MILIRMQGGLGNQMFQYAFGRNVAIKKETELKLDVTTYQKKDSFALKHDTPRAFLLDKFNIKSLVANQNEINRLNPLYKRIYKKFKNKLYGFKNYYFFDENEFNVSNNSYIEGYWQNEKYFKDAERDIRKEFTPKEPLGAEANKVGQKIKSIKTSGRTTVSIHVRRSDYVNTKVNAAFFGSCDKEYYQKAFAELQRKIGAASLEFLIFSDDIEWAKQNLSFPSQTHFISHPSIKDYEELVLMSACDHHIIANSSFSWWGAWLNPSEQKIVIAPKKWLATATIDTSDVVPEGWLKI